MLKFTNLLIPTDDHEAALGFYRDLLGLTVISDFSNGPGRWVNLTLPDQEGLQITLSSVVPHDGLPESDKQALRSLLAKGYLGLFQFATDDLDGLHTRLLQGGDEVIQPPADQQWGARDMAVRDPSGNMVRINQA